MIIAQNRWLFR